MDNYNKKIKEYLNLYNEGMWDNIKSGAKKVINKIPAGIRHAGSDTMSSWKTGAINMGKNALRVGAHLAAGAVGIPLPNKGFMKMSPLGRNRDAGRNEIYKNLLKILSKNDLSHILGNLPTPPPTTPPTPPTPPIDVNKPPHNTVNYPLLANTPLPGSIPDSKDSVYFIDLFDQLDAFETDFLRRRAIRSNKPIRDYKAHPEFKNWLNDKANPHIKA